MSLKIVNVTFNTTNPRELSAWWVEALGGTVTADYEEFVFMRAGDMGLGFQKGENTAANSVHIDLAAEDRKTEVERLVGMGASQVADHEAPGIEWTILADPHGNQFCVSAHS
ncbi:MAG TPA: VOC family protein, partial [Stackebrandtia sp.]|jgi:hypothetical protein|uniref:VOC family protein n=1 Tax=Stackebrandtia sp. TaxID=2023065 RepID=UPI002D6A8B7E